MEKSLREKIKEIESLSKNNASTLEANISDLTEGVSIITDVISDIPKTIDEKVSKVKSELDTKISSLKLKKGDKGDSYILTPKDKKDIASSITVPVVTKIIEKVEKADETPEEIVTKLESLVGDSRLDYSAIRGMDDFLKKTELGDLRRGSNVVIRNGGTSLTGTPTEVVYFDASGNPTSDSLFTSNATTKARVAARTTTQIDTPVQFDGTGANDLTYDASGITTAEPISFEVIISVGDPTSPNKFSWTDSNGGSGTDITILPGLAQTLSNGVDITFASATGHDATDLFAFAVIPSTTTGFYTNDDVLGFGFPGSGVLTEATDGAIDFNGVINLDSGLSSVQYYADAIGDYFTSVVSGKNNYSVNVSSTTGDIQQSFRDGIARWAVNDGTSGTLQLGSAGLLVNDAYLLPTADGTAGQALLSDGAGQSYWGSAGGTPALTDTYIGFGSPSNLLTGSAGFTKVGNVVSLGDISDQGIFRAVDTGGNYTAYTSIGISRTANSGSFAISGSNATGANAIGGNIYIYAGAQTGNATGPYFELHNSRESAASGSTPAALHPFLQNHDAVTILGYASGTGNGTNITVDDLTQLVTSNSGGVNKNTVTGKSYTITDNTTTSVFEVALPDGGMTGGFFDVTVSATDGTDYQAHSDHVTYAAVNKAGAYTTTIQSSNGDDAIATSAGTLTVVWNITTGTDKIIVQVTANSSLTAPTVKIEGMNIDNNNGHALTFLL